MQNCVTFKNKMTSNETDADLAEIKEFGPKIYKIKDFYFVEPAEDSVKNVKLLQTRQDDVWVASFPKSGTTWLQEIVYLIVNNCDFQKAQERTLDERTPFITFSSSSSDINCIHELESPRIFKTHLPYDFLPDGIENKSKVVYITRNPKDTCVSYFHFAKLLRRYSFNGSIKDMMKLFAEGKGKTLTLI